jgi:hypothetical protein
MTANEAERLDVLRQYGILGIDPEVQYNAQLAGQICHGSLSRKWVAEVHREVSRA